MIIAWSVFVLSIVGIVAMFTDKIRKDEDFDDSNNDSRDTTIAIILAMVSAQYIWG